MRCWWGVRTCGSRGSWAQSNSGRTLWRRHKTRRSHGRHRRGWSHCQSWSGHSPTNWLRYRHSWRYHGSLNHSILWAVVPRKKIGCNDRRLLRIVCWEILQRTEWDRWDRWSVSHLRPLSFHTSTLGWHLFWSAITCGTWLSAIDSLSARGNMMVWSEGVGATGVLGFMSASHVFVESSSQGRLGNFGLHKWSKELTSSTIPRMASLSWPMQVLVIFVSEDNLVSWFSNRCCSVSTCEICFVAMLWISSSRFNWRICARSDSRMPETVSFIACTRCMASSCCCWLLEWVKANSLVNQQTPKNQHESTCITSQKHAWRQENLWSSMSNDGHRYQNLAVVRNDVWLSFNLLREVPELNMASYWFEGALNGLYLPCITSIYIHVILHNSKRFKKFRWAEVKALPCDWKPCWWRLSWKWSIAQWLDLFFSPPNWCAAVTTLAPLLSFGSKSNRPSASGELHDIH